MAQRPEPSFAAPLTEATIISGNHSFIDPTYTRQDPARPAQNAPSYSFRGSSFYGAKGSNLDFALQAKNAAADFAHAQAAAAANRASGRAPAPLPRRAPSNLAMAGAAMLSGGGGGGGGGTQILSRDNLPHNTAVEASAAATASMVGAPPRPGVPPDLRPSLVLELAHPQRNAYQREPKMNAHYNTMILEQALRWQPPAPPPAPRRNKLAPLRIDPDTGKPSLKVTVNSKKGPLPREDLTKSMNELYNESKQRQRRRDRDNEGRAQPRAPIHASITFAKRDGPAGQAAGSEGQRRRQRRLGGGRQRASASSADGRAAAATAGQSASRREAAARQSAAAMAKADIAALDSFDRALQDRDQQYRMLRSSLDTPTPGDPAFRGSGYAAGRRIRGGRRRPRALPPGVGGAAVDGKLFPTADAEAAALVEPALALFEMAISEGAPRRHHPAESVRRVPPRPRPKEEPFVPIAPDLELLAPESPRPESGMSFRMSSPSLSSMIKLPETQLNFHVELKAFPDPNVELDM